MSQTLLTYLNVVQVQFTCGRGQFVSVVKSVCKTQLGNQVQVPPPLYATDHR